MEELAITYESAALVRSKERSQSRKQKSAE